MTDSTCVICLCPTDHTLSPTTCGCTFPVHDACRTTLTKCVYCRTGFDNHVDGVSVWSEIDLAKALLASKHHLVNSYFYNSHDLKILLDQYDGVLLQLVSYANVDGKRHIVILEYDSPLVADANAMRNLLMKFHRLFRVQFIFMSVANLPIDESDISIQSLPTETPDAFANLWAMKFQPKC